MNAIQLEKAKKEYEYLAKHANTKPARESWKARLEKLTEEPPAPKRRPARKKAEKKTTQQESRDSL